MRLGVSFLLPLVAPTPGGKAKSGGSCSRPTNNDSARDNKYRERRASCQKRGSWHESHDHVSELLEFLRLPGRLLSSLDAVLFFFFSVWVFVARRLVAAWRSGRAAASLLWKTASSAAPVPPLPRPTYAPGSANVFLTVHALANWIVSVVSLFCFLRLIMGLGCSPRIFFNLISVGRDGSVVLL